MPDNNEMFDNSKVSGIIDSIIFENEENGYKVCRLEENTGKNIIIVGTLPYLFEGDSIEAKGEWVEHKIYGKQFRVDDFEKKIPQDSEEMYKYLASGAVRGVGPKTAEKIVEQFGNDSFDVIENDPELLTVIPGITHKRAMSISEKFKEISESREFMIFSRNYFSPNLAVKIYNKWKNKAIENITLNPYSLCAEFDGIGFKRADQIAEELGFPRDSELRIQSGILYILSYEANTSGHTCLPYSHLLKGSVSLLFSGDENYSEKVAGVIEKMADNKDIIKYEFENILYIYHSYYYNAEDKVAKYLLDLNGSCPSVDEENIVLLIDKIESETGIEYAPMQKRAISEVLKNVVMVITGGPGTGKTTIIKGLLYIFNSMNMKVALAAPTGRAAKRMSEATSYEAKTIHRLLEMEYDSDRITFNRNQSNTIESDVVIIDESSMIDISLMNSLLCALKRGSRLLLIGDCDQLPSVGCGNVLKDIIDSELFKVIYLNYVFRQSSDSKIIYNAHIINSGEVPELDNRNSDFFFLERINETDIAYTVCDLYSRRLPKTYGRRTLNQTIVITPSHKGNAGTVSLNTELQKKLNPPDNTKAEIEFRKTIFRTGDKIMQTTNNYAIEWESISGERGFGIYNGEIGEITDIDTDENLIEIAFDDKICYYDKQMLEDLTLAYAITVHKSQGSEYPIVIIPLYNCSSILLTRNMLYTAITRAKEMVILVGRKDIFELMINNDYHAKRNTMLKDMLKKYNIV